MLRIRALMAGLLLAPALLLVPQTAAYADTCSSEKGVSLVVDYGSLGGGVDTECEDDAPTATAWDMFADEFQLTEVQAIPKFACRIDGLPEDVNCQSGPQGNEYWGLFLTDGTSGEWEFATKGAGQLKIPEGGAVAFAWQDSKEPRVPDVSAPVAGDPSTVTTDPEDNDGDDQADSSDDNDDDGLPVIAIAAGAAVLAALLGWVISRRSKDQQ